MKYIKIAYVNYWNDPYNDKYLSMFIKHNFNCDIINVNCHDNPDILIASVCGNINIIDNNFIMLILVCFIIYKISKLFGANSNI